MDPRRVGRAAGDVVEVVERAGLPAYLAEAEAEAEARGLERSRRTSAALIATDCGPRVTVDTIARSIATSRRQLQRAFSEVGCTTFSAHLFEIRMQRGAALLLRTPASMREVAVQVGDLEPSQFIKRLRHSYGVTPAELRGRREAVRASAAGQLGLT